MTGKNPFAGWQQAKQEKREALVRQFLTYLKKKKVRCKYITDLADMVATHITEQEGKRCVRSTLLRSDRYKVLLLSYMAQQLSVGTDAIARSSIKDPQANALVLTAELGSENLRREISRLKAYIAELESSKPSGRATATATPEAHTGDSVDVIQAKYVATCQALLTVLKHFEGLLRSDSDAHRIVDVSSRPPKVVIDDRLAAPFFEWMHLNRDVGGAR